MLLRIASCRRWVNSALRPAGEIVRSSHERWDGDGYPDRLRGGEIPLGARILAVVDAVPAAMNSATCR